MSVEIHIRTPQNEVLDCKHFPVGIFVSILVCKATSKLLIIYN